MQINILKRFILDKLEKKKEINSESKIRKENEFYNNLETH